MCRHSKKNITFSTVQLFVKKWHSCLCMLFLNYIIWYYKTKAHRLFSWIVFAWEECILGLCNIYAFPQSSSEPLLSFWPVAMWYSIISLYIWATQLQWRSHCMQQSVKKHEHLLILIIVNVGHRDGQRSVIVPLETRDVMNNMSKMWVHR